MDGRVDQCNFLKIIDDIESVPKDGTNANSFGNDQNDSPSQTFNTDFANDMSWMPDSGGGSTKTNVAGGALQGVLPGQGTGHIYEQVRIVHGHMSGYGSSETTSGSAGIDMDFSDQGASDRPTPASSTPGDGHTRGSLSAANGGQGQSSRSGNSSFSTSPAQSGGQNNPNHGTFAADHMDFNAQGDGRAGMMSGNNGQFALPETPGRGENGSFGVPGGWEMNQQGLTPVGEGVFQALMEVGSMDLGWDFEGLNK